MSDFFQRRGIIFLLIFVAFFYVRNLNRYPFEWDEGVEAVYSRKVLNGELLYRDFYYEKGPLTLYLGALALKINNSLMSLRILSGFMGLLFLVAVFNISETLFPKSGFYTASVVATHNIFPWLFYVFHNSYLWATFNLLFLEAFIRKKRFLAGLFFAISFFVKPLSLISVLAILIWSFFEHSFDELISFLKYSFVCFMGLLFLFSKGQGLTLFLKGLMGSGYAKSPVFMFSPVPRLVFLLFMFVFCFSGVATFWFFKSRRLTKNTRLILWVILCFLLFFMVWLNFSEHYLIVASVLFFVFSGKVISDLVEKTKSFGHLTLLILFLSIAVSFYLDGVIYRSSMSSYAHFDSDININPTYDISFYLNENIESDILTDYDMALFLSGHEGVGDIPPISYTNLNNQVVTQSQLLEYISAGKNTPVLAGNRLKLLKTFMNELDLYYEISYEEAVDGVILFTKPVGN